MAMEILGLSYSVIQEHWHQVGIAIPGSRIPGSRDPGPFFNPEIPGL